MSRARSSQQQGGDRDRSRAGSALRLSVWLLLASAVLAARPAGAQSADEPPVHHLQLSLGGALLAGTSLGAADANLRANAADGRSYRLFGTDTRIGSAPALEARVGIGLTRRIALEGEMTVGRPELRSAITADVEGAAAVTVVEQIDEYRIQGRVVIQIEELRLGPRTTPFVTAGAGYLRQLHEGHTVIDTGRIVHVGGGVTHWLSVRDQGLIRAAGLRGDVRLDLFDGGIAFDDRRGRRAVASASLLVVF